MAECGWTWEIGYGWLHVAGHRNACSRLDLAGTGWSWWNMPGYGRTWLAGCGWLASHVMAGCGWTCIDIDGLVGHASHGWTWLAVHVMTLVSIAGPGCDWLDVAGMDG